MLSVQSVNVFTDTMKSTEPQNPDVKTVTTAWTSMSSTRVDPIDERLMKMLSTRAYEAVVERAKAKAMKSYQECFGIEFNDLLGNHENVEKVLGTENDREDGDWRIDPREVSYDELMNEVRTLEKKLERVKSENNDLELGNREKIEKLHLVQEQNERLMTIRDTK